MKDRDSKPRIVVITGPTGIGKTGRAIELAEIFGGEIVNADSMQVYRYMDIGTAKPTTEEAGRVRHHLIDVVDPDEPFDAARYARLARAVIDGLLRRAVVPFVVGGTGFYIKALLYGLFEAQPSDPILRERLKTQARQEGDAAMHALLARKDPATAARLHPHDRFRVVRALEVIALTGTPLSQLQQHHGFAATPYNHLMIGLEMPRQDLYARIDARVHTMLAAGLREEVAGLLRRGVPTDAKAMQSIGYRHMIAFLNGDIDAAETVRTLQRDTRRYAKRQLTWMRRMPGLHWHAVDDFQGLQALVRRFLFPPAPPR